MVFIYSNFLEYQGIVMGLNNPQTAPVEKETIIRIHGKRLHIDISSLGTHMDAISKKEVISKITHFVQSKNLEQISLFSGNDPIISYHKDDFINAINYIKANFTEFSYKSSAIKNDTYTYNLPEDFLIRQYTFTKPELVFWDRIREVIYDIPLKPKSSKNIFERLGMSNFRYKKETQNVLRFAPIGFAALAIILGQIKQMDDPDHLTENKSRQKTDFGTYYSYTLQHKDLPQGLKIIHLSDIHLGINRRENLDHLTRFADEMDSVDFVFLTGDIFDTRNASSLDHDAAEAFQRILSKAGKGFFILGNHDYYVPGENAAIIDMLDSIGYQDATNSYFEVIMNGQKIGIAGLDDYNLGTPDASKIHIDTTDNVFNIMLEHNLDGYAPLQENHQFVDLVLSGHTHSGEIEGGFVNGTISIEGYKNLNHQLVGRKKLGKTNTLSHISPGFATINPLGFRLFANPAGVTHIEFKKIGH